MSSTLEKIGVVPERNIEERNKPYYEAEDKLNGELSLLENDQEKLSHIKQKTAEAIELRHKFGDNPETKAKQDISILEHAIKKAYEKLLNKNPQLCEKELTDNIKNYIARELCAGRSLDDIKERYITNSKTSGIKNELLDISEKAYSENEGYGGSSEILDSISDGGIKRVYKALLEKNLQLCRESLTHNIRNYITRELGAGRSLDDISQKYTTNSKTSGAENELLEISEDVYANQAGHGKSSEILDKIIHEFVQKNRDN